MEGYFATGRANRGALSIPGLNGHCPLMSLRNALVDIFELVDLDGNGTLSREEFNIFQLRTSGEAVDDDAWEVVEGQ